MSKNKYSSYQCDCSYCDKGCVFIAQCQDDYIFVSCLEDRDDIRQMFLIKKTFDDFPSEIIGE